MHHITSPLKAAVSGGQAMLAAMQAPEFCSVAYLARRTGVRSRLLAEGQPIAQHEVTIALDKAGIRDTVERLSFIRALDRLGLIAD